MPKAAAERSVVNSRGGAFGEDVRRVRSARRISQAGLGLATGYSRTYVSKVETGTVLPTQRFAAGCDKAFDTGDLFARQLRRITDGEHPAWFAPHVDAEREASVIRDYSAVFVAGLLQTPEYARVVLRSGWDVPGDEELDAMVASRVRRRQVLEKDVPPRVLIVLHEACLWSQVGPAKLMADQLESLLEMLQQHRTLTVQVLPNTAAAYALSTPFSLLDMPDSDPVVFVEGPQGGRPYYAHPTVANATGYFDHLRACSLSPEDSVGYIDHVRSEHERNASRVDKVQLQRLPGRQLRRVGPGARVRRGRPGAGQ